MLVFFDTEFTSLGVDSRLISIGCITEDGDRTFYAELSDIPVSTCPEELDSWRIWKSKFNVVMGNCQEIA